MGEGKTLGRYKILGELGRGAMGAVYRALDPIIEREVAIKTLLPNLPPDVMADVRERFIREARSAGRLNHPNIVTIFDVGEHDGMAYIAMELLEGEPLQKVLRAGERLSFDAVAEIAAQVAEALDVAQRYSIVHRDVKPANIMVDASGRTKLTDFGVAYMPSSTMTQTGTALGSPRYMSPEQVLGQPIDPRSDIFSLGVVLYEMLTGRTPFESAGDTTVFPLMNRIAAAPHAPLREVDPSIPADFEPIVAKALAKKPEERYARAGEMAADLHRVAGVPASARAVTMPAEGRHPAARPVEDDQARSQLLTDLDRFVAEFDREEQQRLRAEEHERLRKEDEVRRWGEAEARKRDEFERQRGGPDSTATIRREAMELLAKQPAHATRPPERGANRMQAMAALDAAVRASLKYLVELVREINGVHPRAAKPYEFFHLGKIASVTLSHASVESRMRRLNAREVCDSVVVRYRITPARPVKARLAGADLQRCAGYLKTLGVPFQQQAAEITVPGPLPCHILARADYAADSLLMDLANVRRAGRVQCRVPIGRIDAAVDALARYMLGVDDDFAQFT